MMEKVLDWCVSPVTMLIATIVNVHGEIKLVTKQVNTVTQCGKITLQGEDGHRRQAAGNKISDVKSHFVWDKKTAHGKNLFFCCCNKNLCNGNFSMRPTPVTTTSTVTSEPITSESSIRNTSNPSQPNRGGTMYYLVVPFFVIVVILVIGFFMYRRHKTTFPTRILDEEPLNPTPPPSPELGFRPIQRVEVISQGQFGTVWKADYLEDVVAVKVFPMAHKTAWVCEKDIYTTCNMKHENILKFVGVEKHNNGPSAELWLITEYHEHGSLGDYLKSHVITWTELCSMAGSMANGLAYLHTEVLENYFKPCIAHRDFKSKNVLVTKELTCCLSDFGLAMKFDSGGDPGETHGQVGTRRYMAPEVLEGAISFTRESFLYIDMYAFALVLWELVSRCTAADGPVDEYKLPFEEEIGSHPSLEDMQQVVVQQKIRPKFRPDWFVHSSMASLLQTIEECWDQDAEARLTAQCVAERLSQFNPNSSFDLAHSPIVTTVVNNTNITASSKESSI